MKKSKKLTDKQLVKKYIDTLEHFIIPEMGGWPIDINFTDLKVLCESCDCFFINDTGRLTKEKHIPFRDSLLVEFWKYKFEEVDKRYEELYGKVRTLVEDF